MSQDKDTASVSPLTSAVVAPHMGERIAAWTTTRSAGSFGLASQEPVVEVMARWDALETALAAEGITRLASATQVHGRELAGHRDGWTGRLRMHGFDGHITDVPGTALAVTVADCTPVFVAHPRGVIAALHAGWRGTAARILEAGLTAMGTSGCPADECHVHLGPAICGACYEVGPEVFEQMGLRKPPGPAQLDVRSILADQAYRLGVRTLSVSPLCTRCHNGQFYSHRAGDQGRQLGIIALR